MQKASFTAFWGKTQKRVTKGDVPRAETRSVPLCGARSRRRFNPFLLILSFLIARRRRRRRCRPTSAHRAALTALFFLALFNFK
jgi:hypothetical protein